MKKLFSLKMLVLSIFLLCFGRASAADSIVYDDGFGTNWTSFVWGGTVNTATTGNTPFKGTKYVKANFSQAWGGITFTPTGGFSTSGFTNLSLAVRNWQGGQGLYLYIIDGNNVRSSVIYLNDHVDVWYFPGSQWKWVRVPIALLNLTSSTIKSLSIETDSAAEIHYDEIRFESNVTLYEGVRGQRGPTNMLWNWGSSINQQYQEAAYPGDDVLRSDFTQSWGGLQFEIHYHSVFWSSEYKYFTALVKTSTPGQGVYPYFIDADTGKAVLPAVRMADYLPSGVHATGSWQKVTIPIGAFLSGRGGAPVRIGSVVFENEVPGTVLLDNIAVTSPLVLKWPLGAGVPRTVGGYHFGDNWDPGSCPQGVLKKHTGNDYRVAAGTAVYASESGVVKEVLLAIQTSGWAQNIVIEHTAPTGLKYTTVSWHVNSSVVEGSTVIKGQQIGIVADLTPYGHASHYHFGVRMKSYVRNVSGVGALPQNDCDVWPHFPADFVDSEDIKNVLFQ